MPLLLLLLFSVASRIAFRLVHGARLPDVAFPDLYLVLFMLMLRCFLSPPGSAARRWARVAIWVVINSIPLDIAWSFVGPPILKAVVWAIATFSVLYSLYLLIVY